MPALAIIWRTADLLLATHVESVIEILPPVASRPMPGVPGWVRGLFVYRSRLIPLADAARLMGASPADDRMVNRVLVVHLGGSGENAAHDWPLGLWVESVLDLDRIDFDAAGTHPGFATDACRFLGPVAQSRFGQVQLIKPNEIFTPEQMTILTQRMTDASRLPETEGVAGGAA